jgi:nicotinamide phosphoribosyltransferase
MKNRENFILLTDSYKECHHQMYLDGTENVYSYFESRKGSKYPYTVFFGLQMILKRYFEGVVITNDDIKEASDFCKEHFGMNIFNEEMWKRIVDVHGGKLPLKIKAAPEGLPIPISNVMMTVEVTDPKCAPLTNVVETILTHLWHPSNVATISRDIKIYLEKAFNKSVGKDQEFLLPFMLHDFGFRGVSSVESAGLGGAGHLVNFMGTDTIHGITYAKRYYGAGMAGYSVPASEHSVMTSGGAEGEFAMYERLIEKYPTGILSIVSDSYSIERVMAEYLPQLKDRILARDGKVVVRPDSPRYAGDTAAAQIVWIAQQLENTFGATVNEKGFKVLNPKVGIIYGDGLSVEEIKEAVEALMAAGYSAATCVYGMGGGLLQKHNRDTQRSAFKCSAQMRNGEWIDIQKKPLDATKASKAGRMKLVWSLGAHGKTMITVPITDNRTDLLVTVFENGKITKEWNWTEVAENAKTKVLSEAYEN